MADLLAAGGAVLLVIIYAVGMVSYHSGHQAGVSVAVKRVRERLLKGEGEKSEHS